MANNGSPNPIFETDEQTYALVTLPLHNLASTQTKNQARNQVVKQDKTLINTNNQHADQNRVLVRNQVRNQVIDRIIITLNYCMEPKSKNDILNQINLSKQSKCFIINIGPAIGAGLLVISISTELVKPLL